MQRPISRSATLHHRKIFLPAPNLLQRRSYASKPRTYVAAVYTLLLLLVVPVAAIAQKQIEPVSVADAALPDAPSPQVDPQSVSTQGTSSISGTIQDATGAVVAGAQVSLSLRNGKTLHTVMSGSNGQFSFMKLPAGSYLVLVNAKGFGLYTSEEVALSPQQAYTIPNIVLAVGGNVTEVRVLPTEVIAAQQIRQEEKQRLLGIVPNFYVSYEKDAAPMTSKQKLSLAAHDTLDWTSFIGVSASAGIQQATNAHKGYGQGAAGYGKRWGAQFADGRSADFFDHYVFASLFHQDPRYFYQGTGTTKSRLYHAVSSAFVSRSDSGKTMPNYSYLLGTMCAGALSNAYYPAADRGPGLVFTTAGIGIAGRAGAAVLQEFLGKKLTKNAPKSAPVDPAPSPTPNSTPTSQPSASDNSKPSN